MSDDADPKGMPRPSLTPVGEVISDGISAYGGAFSDAVRNMGTRDKPRTRPMLSIHERNRPAIPTVVEPDQAPPSGMPRPRLPRKDPT
jgi:hypothetical protein